MTGAAYLQVLNVRPWAGMQPTGDAYLLPCAACSMNFATTSGFDT
jgi:hypothetical protein